MSWSYLPEPAEESTEACCSDTLPSALWKSLTTTGARFCSASETESSRGFQCGTTCAHSTAVHGEDMSTSCQEDFPARTSAQPGKAPESTARSPASGERWRASFARFDRVTFSWRTVQCSLFEDSAQCSVIWPRSGMTVGGHAYPLPTVGRRTSGTESGLWQTPVADDSVDRKAGKWNGRGEPQLSAQVTFPTPNSCTIANDVNVQCSGGGRQKPNKLGWYVAAEMLRTPKASDADKGGRGELLHQIKTGSPRGIPTPRANDAQKRGNIDATNPRNGLAGFLRMPTPVSSDWKGSSKPGQRRGQLTDLAMGVITAGGRLNPTFVEWLMGWPIGSTALSPLAMARFREFVQQHGEY